MRPTSSDLTDDPKLQISKAPVVLPDAPRPLSRMVRAGAGAGKTTTLIRYVLESAQIFRRDSGRYPQIVVTTFTRKATQELRERLIRKASEMQDRGLLEFVSSESQMLISTIHGVLNLFLKRYGHLMDLDPGFSLLTGAEEDRLIKMELREEFLAAPEALCWLETFDIHRLARMARAFGRWQKSAENLRPVALEDLVYDFTMHVQRLSDEGVEIALTLKETTLQPKFVEFAEIIRSLSQDLKTLSADNFAEKMPLLLRALPNKPQYRKDKTDVPEDLDQQIRRWMTEVREMGAEDFVSPTRFSERVQATQEFGRFLQQVSARFERLKNQKGFLAMDDLELKALSAQRSLPALAQNFADGFDLWLVDEFQDTSPLQIEILRGFMGDRPRFVVGDPQQSIYLFRGARSEVFQDYSEEMKKQGAQLEHLDKNYRSRPELLHFFNEVFAHFGSQFTSMAPKAPGSEPSAVVATLSRLENEEEQKRALVARLHQLLHGGDSFSDLCVLGRTNKELQNLAMAASQSGLPVYVHQTQGFFRRREILDALAVLKFLCQPYDNENLLQILRSPWAKVSDEVLSQALANAGECLYPDLFESLPQEPGLQVLQSYRNLCAQRGIVEAFRQALRGMGFFERALAIDPSGRMESNLWKLLLHLEEETKKPGFLLLEFLQDEQQTRDLDLGDEEGDAVSALEPNRINFMTVHASKGLEFKHVLLAGLESRPRQENLNSLMLEESEEFYTVPWPESSAPQLKATLTEQNILQIRRDREMAESARVFYVALTRARESVHMFAVGGFQRGSWAQGLEWLFEKGEGVHRLENCSVEILHKSLPLVPFALMGRESAVVRPRLEIPDAVEQQRVSVTDLLAGTEREEKEQDWNPRLLGLAQRGVALHRVFESLRYQPDYLPEDLELSAAVEFVQSLQEPPMKELLKTGSVEWGFQIQTPRGRLQGQMDLMGEVEGKLWVVDYKSGSLAGKDRAFAQLKIYGWCLRQRYPGRPIFLSAIFPF